jgi:GMP synthase (glutamine-hydrolysing)
MHVHFIIHEAFEAPGVYEDWIRDRGHHATYSRVYERQPLPAAVAGIDMLVVMGGPQSPTTSREECPHFDAAAECALIRQVFDAGKVVVGVCLGAQLLGTAMGAMHGRSPEKEIGKFPVTLTKEGRAHPLLSDFPDTFDSGHWHGDMPGLPLSARVLAVSEGCPRQIVEYGPLAYGFQCHLEFTPAVVELLIQASERELVALAAHRFVQQPAVLRAHDYTAMNHTLMTFLDRLVAAYRVS